MPLVPEDGSNVANANSYATRAEIISYAALRGVTIADDAAADVCAIKAMDYIEVQKFKGEPTYGVVGVDQETQFPRDNIAVGTTYYANDEIPDGIKAAQCEAATLISQGIELNVNRSADTQAIKRDKTGPLETEYFAPPAFTPDTPRLDALLEPFIVGFGGLIAVKA